MSSPFAPKAEWSIAIKAGPEAIATQPIPDSGSVLPRSSAPIRDSGNRHVARFCDSQYIEMDECLQGIYCQKHNKINLPSQKAAK
jgi:hypothetical protein